MRQSEQLSAIIAQCGDQEPLMNGEGNQAPANRGRYRISRMHRMTWTLEFFNLFECSV